MAVVLSKPQCDNRPRVVVTLQWRHNGAIAFQITSLTIVYSIVYSDADQRKHQSCASLAFVRGIHRGPMNSPHKWPVTRKLFPFDDVIMTYISTSVIIRDGLWRVTIRVQIAYCHQMIKWNMKLDDSVRAPRAPIGLAHISQQSNLNIKYEILKYVWSLSSYLFMFCASHAQKYRIRRIYIYIFIYIYSYRSNTCWY